MIAFTDGSALICVVPSGSSNGVYLVRAEPSGPYLLISHECPACLHGKACKHVSIGTVMFRRWQWWEPEREIRTITKRIVLQPEWEQVTLPVNLEESLRAVSIHAS